MASAPRSSASSTASCCGPSRTRMPAPSCASMTARRPATPKTPPHRTGTHRPNRRGAGGRRARRATEPPRLDEPLRGGPDRRRRHRRSRPRVAPCRRGGDRGVPLPDPDTEFWTPYDIRPYTPPTPEDTAGQPGRTVVSLQSFMALGRLRPGVSAEQAATEARGILQGTATRSRRWRAVSVKSAWFPCCGRWSASTGRRCRYWPR